VDAILQVANETASLGELSDVDAEPDTSSSLSEVDYKDSHQEEEGELSDDGSIVSDEENDSEAETERLEESPDKIRTHKAVLLTSRHDNPIYERSPSKLHNQIIPDIQQDEEDDEVLSDDDLSLNESPQSSVRDEADSELPTAPTSLEDSTGEDKRTLSITDADSRKRKRSIMAGGGLDDEEPLRKRTGSIMNSGDDFAVNDEEQCEEEEADVSNPISGTISGDEGGEEQEEGAAEEVEEPVIAEEGAPDPVELPESPKKRGRKKKKTAENGISNLEEDPEILPEADTTMNGQDEAGHAEEDTAEVEGIDGAEVAARLEEERKPNIYCHFPRINADLNPQLRERELPQTN